jgi:maltodextrin utilization protein YvdJ
MACPVCFGDSNEPMAIATNYGIWFMLGIVAVMLSAFASFFVYLMRRAKLARIESDSEQMIRRVGAPGLDNAGQEGTA